LHTGCIQGAYRFDKTVDRSDTCSRVIGANWSFQGTVVLFIPSGAESYVHTVHLTITDTFPTPPSTPTKTFRVIYIWPIWPICKAKVLSVYLQLHEPPKQNSEWRVESHRHLLRITFTMTTFPPTGMRAVVPAVFKAQSV
jgi:hypothetical protein